MQLQIPGMAKAHWMQPILFNIGINFMREHVKPSARIHYVYKQAGNVPNVIPDVASVWIWIRDY
jgi:aminobenzoyl-glutamate utilization protein B